MVWISISRKENHHQKPLRCVPSQQLRASHANTFFEHACALDINSKPSPLRLTSIICTIGPACLDPVTIEKMIESGMNIACLNLTHGAHEYHAEAIRNIRSAAKNYSERVGAKCPVAIAIETKGPKIRTGFPVGGRCTDIELKEGETIRLTTDPEYVHKGSSKILFVDYENIHKVVHVGSKIGIDANVISLICTSIEDSGITCLIEKGGFIGSRRRIHLPGSSVDLPTLSKKDKADIAFGIEQNVDIIFASFIRDAAGVKEIRDLLAAAGKKIMIVSKIENKQALDNIDNIISVSDGVMIVRGHLGVEIDSEEVFLAQKSIIGKCNKTSKSVICTNQMLESMVKNPKPTQAEISDVANAVLDGVDCVMLCNETSKGDYPIESIRMMDNICKEAEAAYWGLELYNTFYSNILPPINAALAVAMAAAEISVTCKALAIVIVSGTLTSAKILSGFRPRCPIIAVTRDATAARQIHLSRGVIPLIFKAERIPEWHKDLQARVYYGINFGRKKGFLRAGDPIVLMTPSKQGTGFVDNMKIITVSVNISPTVVCVC